MKKTLPFFYFGLVPLAAIIDLKKVYYFRNFFSALLLYLMILYFFRGRNSPLSKKDTTFIKALTVIFISELSIGLIDNLIIKVVINTIGFFVSQNLLINIFRKEGAIFPDRFYKKDRTLWIFTIIVFAIFMIAIPKIPPIQLIPSLFFLVQITFLVWMASLRPVEEGKKRVVYGILFFMIAQFWLLITDFIFDIPYKTLIYILFYSITGFLIVNGFLQGANKVEA
jgi:hypothetical protein